MPGISYIHPLDQPLAKRRLLSELKSALSSPDFSSCSIASAAVSLGPLSRLDTQFKLWKASGKSISAIYGVDIGATTAEALAYSMLMFDHVYISRIPGIKFHPKLYVFKGAQRGLVFYGSNNLTVPGTETNFEATVCVDYALPAENAGFDDALRGWNDLIAEIASNTVVPLTAALLGQLTSAGLVTTEKNLAATVVGGKGIKKTQLVGALPMSTLKKVPPSALAKTPLVASAPLVTPTATNAAMGVASPAASASADTLVMQIKPHANGEIFLSKMAVDQNPSFFGFPFTGWTTPKKQSNPSYPQRLPDPIVNIDVYGPASTPALSLVNYPLNTVFYDSKSEIRITCSPLVGKVPDYSILVMSASVALGVDYDIEIYRPDSGDYSAWLNVCNQTMPSGGMQARKFGWL